MKREKALGERVGVDLAQGVHLGKDKGSLSLSHVSHQAKRKES